MLYAESVLVDNYSSDFTIRVLLQRAWIEVQKRRSVRRIGLGHLTRQNFQSAPIQPIRYILQGGGNVVKHNGS